MLRGCSGLTLTPWLLWKRAGECDPAACWVPGPGYLLVGVLCVCMRACARKKDEQVTGAWHK